MELINKDDTICALEAKKDGNAKGSIGGFYNTIIQKNIETIKSMPPVLSEIIHCGECIYLMEDGRCFTFADDAIKLKASDYCSYGERKSDG